MERLVDSIKFYGSENMKNKIMALDMDYLSRASRVSRKDRIRNEMNRNMIELQKTIMDRIIDHALRWLGHTFTV